MCAFLNFKNKEYFGYRSKILVIDKMVCKCKGGATNLILWISNWKVTIISDYNWIQNYEFDQNQ